MALQSVVVFVLFVAAAAATDVRQCPGRSDEGLQDNVQLSPCKRLPCKLKKGTEQSISITFTPETDITDITNHVTALVLSLNVPFFGVDRNSICDKLFTESGEQAACPVTAGQKYVYKDSFPILSIYPTLDTIVHWELQHKGKVITCFEVPVKIKG